MNYPKATNIRESLEGLLFYTQDVILASRSNNGEVLMRQGELAQINEKAESLRSELRTLEQMIAEAKTKIAVEEEKAKVSVAKLYQDGNAWRAESLKLLDSVKKFVGKIEMQEYNRLQKEGKNILVPA